MKKETPLPQGFKEGDYNDLHAYDVTCLKDGSSKVTLVVGNSPSSTNRYSCSSICPFQHPNLLMTFSCVQFPTNPEPLPLENAFLLDS